MLCSILDLDPEKSLESQLEPKEGEVVDGPSLKDDPKYQKYYKMMTMGLPKYAVKHAMTRDRMDPRYVFCVILSTLSVISNPNGFVTTYF